MSDFESAPWIDEKDKAKLGAALQTHVEILEKSPYETARRQALLRDAELYLGVPLTDLYQIHGGGYESKMATDESIAFNIGYSIVGTIRNRICSFRPRAQFLPNGGDYKARRGARDMTGLSDAWAEATKWQREASYMFRDLLTGDGGVLKHYIDGTGDEKDTVKAARFPAWEFMFDEAESIYGEPECGYHVTHLPVRMAARKYKVEVEKLRSRVVNSTSAAGILYIPHRDLVRIIEAYHRGPEGRHVIVVGDEVIRDEPWEFDGFPWVIKKFDENMVGLWGDGAIRRLRPLQLELIEWARSMRDAHYLASQQVHLIQDDEAAPQKVTNEIVRMVRYTNTPPQIVNPPAVNAEMYQYYRTLRDAGYETLGIAQSTAKGEKQPGVDSAVAIRESSELQTDRLSGLSQIWEEIRVESADWWWRLTKQLATRKESPVKPKWRAVSRGVWRELTVGDMDQEWEIRRFPSSVFGQTVSGRFQRATELIQGGFLSKEDALKALDIPDLGPIIDLTLAQSYAMESLVDGMLEDGHYETPDEQIDPVALHAYAKNRYLLAISDDSNYPAANMAKLRTLLAYIEPRAKAALAAAQPQPPAPPPAPGRPAPAQGAGPDQVQAQQIPVAA